MSEERARAAATLMESLTDAELVQVLVKAVEVKGSANVEAVQETPSGVEGAKGDV